MPHTYYKIKPVQSVHVFLCHSGDLELVQKLFYQFCTKPGQNRCNNLFWNISTSTPMFATNLNIFL